jgi:hypothetical protein
MLTQAKVLTVINCPVQGPQRHLLPTNSAKSLQLRFVVDLDIILVFRPTYIDE